MRRMKLMRTRLANAQRLIRHHRRWLAVPVAAGILAVGSVMFVSRAYNPPAPDPIGTPAPTRAMPAPAANTAQGAQPTRREPIQVVSFALYDVGILPYEAHVSKGLVAVTLEDLSAGSTGLIVERDNNGVRERAGQVERPPQGRGRNELRLEPGRYDVYMADQPDNRAVLIVEP